MTSFLAAVVDLVWGPSLVLLLFGGGLYLLVLSKGRALKHIGLGLRLLFGKSKFGHQEQSEGQLSHFKALSNALAATVGLGNIAGVAVAITQGGAGALFWMWVSGFIGMNTKFFESTLSLMFRDKDCYQEIQGGPMYYIPKVLPNSLGKMMGVLFAIFGLIGTQALFQTNQLAGYLQQEVNISPSLTGLVSAVLVGLVLAGGLKRMAEVTSSVVPAMCLLYTASCLTIVALNFSEVPRVFGLIFSEAFSFKAAGGGFFGYAIVHAFKVGVKRGVFSNEAGVGTAPMAHGNAKTSEPVGEGLVAMVGPLVDTLIVCTMTALVILIAAEDADLNGKVEGIKLTSRAFESSLGAIGVIVLGVTIFAFSFSTMIGMANYNEKCWNYLFKGHSFFRRPTFVIFFCLMLFYGAVGSIENVVNILDVGYGLMAYPNMLVVLLSAPLVIKELKAKLG